MNDNTQHSLATYVSDMIALEKHVLAPIETQNTDSDFTKVPVAAGAVAKVRSTLQSHITALEPQLERLRGHEAAALKNAVASFTGAVAGAIDKSRRTEVSKGLRDDYVALSQIAISYTMLHATALGTRDGSLARLAQANLNEITPLIVEISRIMPTIVVNELAADGLDVDTTVGSQAESNTQEAWSSASR